MFTMLGLLLTCLALALLAALPAHTPAYANAQEPVAETEEPEPTQPPDPTEPPEPTDDGDDGEGPRIDLELVKEVSVSNPVVGQQIEFVLTITHREGGGWADDVVIEDTLPPFLELIGAETSWGELTTEGNTVRVFIDRLFPGDVVVVRIYARVLSEVAPPDNVNTATVTTPTNETTTENNTDSVALLVRPPGGPNEEDPTPSPQAPEVVPTATATADVVQPTPVQPTPVPPTPTPAPPVVLPETGSGSSAGYMPILPIALGIGLILLGLAAMLARQYQR
jgi:hypothetical protein